MEGDTSIQGNHEFSLSQKVKAVILFIPDFWEYTFPMHRSFKMSSEMLPYKMCALSRRNLSFNMVFKI